MYQWHNSGSVCFRFCYGFLELFSPLFAFVSVMAFSNSFLWKRVGKIVEEKEITGQESFICIESQQLLLLFSYSEMFKSCYSLIRYWSTCLLSYSQNHFSHVDISPRIVCLLFKIFCGRERSNGLLLLTFICSSLDYVRPCSFKGFGF